MNSSSASHSRGLRALGAAALLCLLGACSAAAPADSPATASTPPAAATPAPTPAAQRERILGLVGEARCDADAQCRTLPMGSKPCGGPESYLAWSSQQTPAEPLQTLAAQYAAARRAEAQRLGLLSNCMVVTDPGARCIAQHCVLRSATSALPQ